MHEHAKLHIKKSNIYIHQPSRLRGTPSVRVTAIILINVCGLVTPYALWPSKLFLLATGMEIDMWAFSHFDGSATSPILARAGYFYHSGGISIHNPLISPFWFMQVCTCACACMCVRALYAVFAYSYKPTETGMYTWHECFAHRTSSNSS